MIMLKQKDIDQLYNDVEAILQAIVDFRSEFMMDDYNEGYADGSTETADIIIKLLEQLLGKTPNIH